MNSDLKVTTLSALSLPHENNQYVTFTYKATSYPKSYHKIEISYCNMLQVVQS